jgi:hypothetical protein
MMNVADFEFAGIKNPPGTEAALEGELDRVTGKLAAGATFNVTVPITTVGDPPTA